MKTFAEFLKAFETDESLKSKLEKALENAKAKTDEAKISAIVKFATENGYNVKIEDFSRHQAEGKELDEEELMLVTGAGKGKEETLCSGDVIYICAADYACAWLWNTCRVSNENQRCLSDDSSGECDWLLW